MFAVHNLLTQLVEQLSLGKRVKDKLLGIPLQPLQNYRRTNLKKQAVE